MGGGESVPSRLSDAEIHYLWHFIDGSIMDPDTRRRLRRAWGLCQRHAYGFLVMEAAYRGWLHGAAILYADLMDQAARAVGRGYGLPAVLRHRLRDQGPCMLCEMGYGPGQRARAEEALLAPGRNTVQLHRFAQATRRHWQRCICGVCAGDPSLPNRCRGHLRTDAGEDFVTDVRLIAYLQMHMQKFQRSFRWEERGSDTAEDRAALIAAVGWCSGWQELLPRLEWQTRAEAGV